jgi:hypothetical protein
MLTSSIGLGRAVASMVRIFRLRRCPYLASRGMSWIQHHAKPGLSDGELKDYIR